MSNDTTPATTMPPRSATTRERVLYRAQHQLPRDPLTLVRIGWRWSLRRQRCVGYYRRNYLAGDFTLWIGGRRAWPNGRRTPRGAPLYFYVRVGA